MTKEQSMMSSLDMKNQDLPFTVNSETGEVMPLEEIDKESLSKKIEEANKSVKTIKLKRNSTNKKTGVVTTVTKDYAEVPQRVKAFRKVYPNGSIVTDIIDVDEKSVTMKTVVKDEQGRVLSTGIASENTGKNATINSTSMYENCETSAVGRALGFAGFGINDSIASYEEVKEAETKQSAITSPEKGSSTNATAKQIWVLKNKIDPVRIENELFKLNKSTIEELTAKEASDIIGGK